MLRVVRVINLDIPDHYFCSVSMTTQAAYQINVQIFDRYNNVLFDQTRQSQMALPMINDTFLSTSDGLSLQVSCEESNDLDIRLTDMTIKAQDDIISQSYLLVAEDSGDYDYNDLWLTISSWRYQG